MHYIVSILLSILLGISSIKNNRETCRCAEDNRPTWDAIYEADAVFTGRVVTITRRSGTLSVQFEVDQLWKGVIEVEKVVSTPHHSCGWRFQTGESYLVYAYGNERGLYTHLCTRTAKADDWKNQRFMPDDFRIPREYRDKCNYGNLFDPAAKKGCERMLYFICGCDGNTYGSICEAEKRGVFTYRSGPCER